VKEHPKPLNLNIIWVFNPTRTKVLMCKRHKQPYKGLFNLVGGKIERDEDGLSAAYRELREETGIREADIKLTCVMDFIYHLSDACRLEVYAGTLKHDVTARGDEKELVWIDVTEDFFDMARFAGEGNIGHIYEIIKMNIQPKG
jgi:8-oxo-dGTP diphosphatase